MSADPERAGLEAELTELADARAWHAWDRLRLVYADWLEEHRKPRLAALARLTWQVRPDTLGTHCVTWRCLLPAPIRPALLRRSKRHYKLLGCINRWRFLHFRRGDLRLSDFRQQRDLPRFLLWTHQIHRRKAGYYDVGAHARGFAALLDPALTSEGAR